MKLQFDPDQAYQHDAIAAIADLFEGRPRIGPDFSVIRMGDLGGIFAGQERTELGIGNQMSLSGERLLANARDVQARNDIEVADPKAPLEKWEIIDAAANTVRDCPHFSVEMETGTGKTYVYLRTMFELSQRYGFQKFVIVVPSVAIRAGVIKNIEITREHFREFYNHLPLEPLVYDRKNVNCLRQFAISNTLQVLIINIDAFRKNFTGTEDERKSNVIYKESDSWLSGRQPIEFIQATRPIVIIDEPQSVDSTAKSQEAICALNPLCTLRYSATHRNPYNLVYRLDPVKAFKLGLVKQIVVASAVTDGGVNDAFVRVEKIDYKPKIRAKVRIHVQTPEGPKEQSRFAKNDDDLYRLSGGRVVYENGYVVTEINAEPGNEFIQFNNGKILRLGEESGGLRDDVWRVQIKHTVKRHLEKELELRGRGIKVLSLFFIDRVANYRDYDATGQPVKGKVAEIFEAALTELGKEARYGELEWLKLPIAQLHNGYFAADKKNIPKDTGGDSVADETVYKLIMEKKEQLLSENEPLRFIFSHSALREGWDNPNVFQICTLNETRSEMKKRQEIGRGLRLPVDQNGARVFDKSVNRLFVMANESYEDFAKTLQDEYEKDCGMTFGRVTLAAIARIQRIVEAVEQPIGLEAAEVIRASLVKQNMLDVEGRIQPAFDPRKPGFKIDLPEGQTELTSAVIDLLDSYRVERYIQREGHVVKNRLKKDVQLSPDFIALWERIKPRTAYRVEFQTDELIRQAVKRVQQIEVIERPKIRVITGQIDVQHGGVVANATSSGQPEFVTVESYPVPDVLAYLQNETKLTRSTLFRILKESGRLSEFFNDPQRFMDEVAKVLREELHRLLVDGIKYEKIAKNDPDAEWEMMRFKDEIFVNYLTALQVNRSVYEYVVYESDVELEFARKLDKRNDISLFAKLPGWFEIDTPVGKYNPDWAIVKCDGLAMYLIRETKSTKDYLKLRTSEADKVRCGQRHFETLGVPFSVVVTADEV